MFAAHTPASAREINNQVNPGAKANITHVAAKPDVLSARIGRRPTLSLSLPQIGAKMNWQSE
jgi:hypothetical protein